MAYPFIRNIVMWLKQIMIYKRCLDVKISFFRGGKDIYKKNIIFFYDKLW